jgi:hypothetical protein
MAWADGTVSRAERKLICALAKLHGTMGDTPAFAQLEEWLRRRPPEKFIQGSWCAVQAILGALPEGESSVKKDSILRECRAVASVSGRMLHRICAAEHEMLAEMERELPPRCEVPATAGFP